MMGPHNYLSHEGPMWPQMIFDDMSATVAMAAADMAAAEDAMLPTPTSFDPSLFLCPALESVCAPPFEEDIFTGIPLINNTEELEPLTPLGTALVESFMIRGPWLSVDSPTSTGAHASLATSPLEQMSPWTTPGPLQAPSPVAPIEGHYMLCPPPDLYHNGPEMAPRWPPGQADGITTAFLSLSKSLAFWPYFNGQDQPWMNGQLPILGPLATGMSLTGTSTALPTFYTPPVPLPAKNTMVGGKQSRQRLTKAGRKTK